MIVYNLRNFLTSRGITVSGSNKNDLLKPAQVTSKLGLHSNVDFHDNVLDSPCLTKVIR